MIRPIFTEIGLFLTPFVLYAAFLIATRAGVLRSAVVDAAAHRLARHRLAHAGGRQLRAAGAVFRRAAGLDLCAGACRRRQVRAGNDAMTDGAHLGDAAWLKRRRRRASARAARSRRRGGARRRRRGAQCVDGVAGRRDRRRDDRGAATRSCAASKRPGSRRCRPASSTAPSPWSSTAIRSKSRPCARTSKPTAARPRSRSAATGKPMPSGATSPSTRFRLARRHGLRLCRRPRRYRRAPGALHRRSGSAHRRGLSAHPALLPLSRLVRPRRARRRRPAACIAARSGLDTLSRERVRMEMLKLMVAPHAAPTLAVMAEAGMLGTVLGGVPLLASFENMVKAEAAIGAAPDAVRRLGALGVQVDGRRRAAGAAAAAVQRRARAAHGAGILVAGAARGRRARGACIALSAWAGSLSPIAC